MCSATFSISCRLRIFPAEEPAYGVPAHKEVKNRTDHAQQHRLTVISGGGVAKNWPTVVARKAK